MAKKYGAMFGSFLIYSKCKPDGAGMMSFWGGCAIYSASQEVEHMAITRPSLAALDPKKLGQNIIVDGAGH